MAKISFKTTSPFGQPSSPGKGGLGSFKFTLADALKFYEQFKMELIAGSLVVLIVGVITYFIFVRYNDIRVINQEVLEMTEKTQPLADYNKAVKVFQQNMLSFPEAVPESRFITHITFLANKRGIAITEITPPEYQDEGFFRKATVQVAFKVADFRDAMFLLNDLETSSYSFAVQSFSARLLQSLGNRSRVPGGSDGDKNQVEVRLLISSIETLENERK